VANADDSEPSPGEELQVHAFVSQGYLKSTDNNFLAESERGSFEFMEAGVNGSRMLTKRLRIGMQLFTRDLGPQGNYAAKVDWAYLDYRWRDWLGLRAGRIKLPFGLYNDTSDIDAAHPTVLLPQSVYPAQNRDFLLAQTGFELYGYRDVGRLGAVDYRAYAGTIFLDAGTQPPGSAFGLVRLTIPYLVGGRVLWEPPVEGLRVGASIQKLRLETDLLDLREPQMPIPVSADISATLAMASLEYAADDILFAAEYARWYTSVESSDPMLVPEQSATSVRAYGLVAYRVSPRAQPGAYYSVLYPGTLQSTGKSARQHDTAGTLRIDLDANWLLKLEVHYMRGTAGLSTSLNPGTTLDGLANRWLLFVAKTTVYF
jgi:hypothetical protein